LTGCQNRISHHKAIRHRIATGLNHQLESYLRSQPCQVPPPRVFERHAIATFSAGLALCTWKVENLDMSVITGYGTPNTQGYFDLPSAELSPRTGGNGQEESIATLQQGQLC